MKFSLEISFLGDVLRVCDLESTDYGYLSLLNDVCGAAIGSRTGWLSNMISVQAVMPDTGKTITIKDDEDIRSLIAIYLSLEEEIISVSLHICNSTSSVVGFSEGGTSSNPQNIEEIENLIEAEIVGDTVFDDEGSIEIEEIAQWSDSETEGHEKEVDEECVQIFSDKDEDQEELSDYNSEKDQTLFHSDEDSDEDVVIKNPMKALSENMEGKYFEYQCDNNGNLVITLEEGMIFDNVDHFKNILARYAIQEGLKLKKVKNDKVRVTTLCNNSKDCQWRLHASKYADGVTFKIKNITGIHTCIRNLKSSGATAKWIANEFKEEYKVHPEKSVEELDGALRLKFGVHAHSSKLYRARKLAMQVACGDHEESYAKIPKYIVALKESNNGAFVKLKCDGLDISDPNCSPKFERIFISFEAQYQGYIKGCRPFIGIDGCFLKGPYKGEVFTAVTLDANSGIFPIAIMVCEGESEDSWNYFFDCLNTYMQDERVITFMSDRQKGLKKAVSSIFPVLRQRYYARHLYANFRAKYPGPKLRKLFWIAVNSYTEQDFKNAMEKIKATDGGAYKWLMETCKEDPSTWSRHGFDEAVKVDHVTNNMTESFNAFLGKMRQKPVITLLEWYRTKIMKRFFTRYQKALTWQELPPNVTAKVEKNQRQGRKLLVVPSSEVLFEVYDDIKYIVNIKNKTCQCREWQVSGVPCKHAMGCILFMRHDPVQYVDQYLTTKAYLRTYEGMISAVYDESKWKEHPQIPPLQAPTLKRKNRIFKQGRLQTKRRREKNEPSKGHKRSIHITCSICHEIGHNKKTCSSKKKSTSQDLFSQGSTVVDNSQV